MSNFMSTDPNTEHTTSELNTSKKRYNSRVKVTICTTNSNSNINKQKNTLFKHWITLAVVLTQRREHDSDCLAQGFIDWPELA